MHAVITNVNAVLPKNYLIRVQIYSNCTCSSYQFEAAQLQKRSCYCLGTEVPNSFRFAEHFQFLNLFWGFWNNWFSAIGKTWNLRAELRCLEEPLFISQSLSSLHYFVPTCRTRLRAAPPLVKDLINC